MIPGLWLLFIRRTLSTIYFEIVFCFEFSNSVYFAHTWFQIDHCASYICGFGSYIADSHIITIIHPNHRTNHVYINIYIHWSALLWSFRFPPLFTLCTRTVKESAFSIKSLPHMVVRFASLLLLFANDLSGWIFVVLGVRNPANCHIYSSDRMDVSRCVGRSVGYFWCGGISHCICIYANSLNVCMLFVQLLIGLAGM